MELIVNPPRGEWAALVERNIPDDAAIESRVAGIVERVRREGDAGLRALAREIDGADVDALALSPEEIEAACRAVPEATREAVRVAAENITAFHAAQRSRPVEVETCPGVRCMQRAVPIRRVGLYIPGGRAPLFSTVLMLALPARIAGCAEVVLCTPQGRSGRIAPEIIYAARTCGVARIFRVGGAQAVAAMAYGTESVPRVDKIFGPGNRYVTKAKQLVSRHVAIDMPAGPSEVLVMADATARPPFVASDLLSQAEHGPDSQAMLVCDDEELARAVAAEVERRAALLPRRESVAGSLSHSRIVVLGGRDEMVDFANTYAAEHLIVAMADPWAVAERITAAGSVFVGHYSPESAGDYASGTNHTLPTNGYAKAYSGVSLDSFIRKMTFQEIKPEGLCAIGPAIEVMAANESLDGHKNAVSVRLEAVRNKQ